MRIEVGLKVESEHPVDLKRIAELTKGAWVPRSELEDEFEDREYIMCKTEDGYWRTIVKGVNKKISNTRKSEQSPKVSSLKGGEVNDSE